MKVHELMAQLAEAEPDAEVVINVVEGERVRSYAVGDVENSEDPVLLTLGDCEFDSEE